MKHNNIIHYFLITLALSLILPACSSKNKELSQEEIDSRVQKEIAAANDLIAKDHPSRAIKVLEQIQEKYPSHIKVLEALGFAYSDTGDPGLGAFYFEQILQIDPTLLEYRIFAAQAYAENEDWKEASRNYETYLKSFPNDKSTWLALATTHEQNKQPIKAAEAFLNAHKLSNTAPSADGCFKIAQLYEQAKEQDQALIWYYNGIKEDPERTEVLIKLLKVELQAQNLPLAERHLKALEGQVLSNVDAHFLTSAQEKVQAWRNILAKQAEEREAQEALERKALALKEVEEVLKQTVDEVAPEVAEEDAKYFAEDLEATAEVTEEAHEVVEEVATTEAQEADEETPVAPVVKKEPVKKVAIKKRSSRELIQEALETRKTGDYEGSIKLMWDAITRNAKPAVYWHELSETYAATGDFGNAEMTALEVLRRAPHNIHYNMDYIDILRQTGNRQKWFSELKRVKEQFPNNPDITLALAKAYQHIEGNSRNARFMYEQFVSLAPYHPEREQAERMIAELK